MHTMLVTGFGLWEGVTYNPTGLVARELDGQTITGAGSPVSAKIVGRVLDVAWADGSDAVTINSGASVTGAARALAQAVNDVKPDLLLSFGVIPSGMNQFDVEPEADDRNRLDARDVRGQVAARAREHETFPQTLALAFPAKAIMNALKKEGLDAVSSPGLGNYLCERIAYEGAWLAKYGPHRMRMSGFIHVPNPMVQATGSSASTLSSLDASQKQALATGYAQVLRGAKLAVETCLAHLQDDRLRTPAWRDGPRPKGSLLV